MSQLSPRFIFTLIFWIQVAGNSLILYLTVTPSAPAAGIPRFFLDYLLIWNVQLLTATFLLQIICSFQLLDWILWDIIIDQAQPSPGELTCLLMSQKTANIIVIIKLGGSADLSRENSMIFFAMTWSWHSTHV